jgi:hypothetical protein
VPPRHDRIIEQDVSFLGSPKNEVRRKRNEFDRYLLVQYGADRVGGIRARRRRFIRRDSSERQNYGSYLNMVTGFQRSSTGNPVAVHRGSSLTSEIFDKPVFSLEEDSAMTAGYLRMAQYEVHFSRPPNDNVLAGKNLAARRETGENGDLGFQSCFS